MGLPMMIRRALPFTLLLTGCFGEVGPMGHDSGPEQMMMMMTPMDSGSMQPVDSGHPPMDSGTQQPSDSGTSQPDAGPVDSGVPDAGGKIPVFIAQGGEGRTIMSCDDGRTWVGDRSWDKEADPLMCSMMQTKQCFNDNCSYEENNS